MTAGSVFMESFELRSIGGITIIGPDLFAVDEQGVSLSPIASAFPKYRTVITGRSIHAMQTMAMIEFRRSKLLESGNGDLSSEEELDIFTDAVSLLIRNGTVLIRSNPDDMDRIFAADEMLQQILPKDRIQFTGIQLASIRRKLRRRGESWRISPPPHSIEEICSYITSSRVHVGTGATYYQNAPTGGRFLTYEEFVRIRPLLTGDPVEALAQLKEIVMLGGLVNKQGARELNFLLPADKALRFDKLIDLTTALESASTAADVEAATRLFDAFAGDFSEAAGPELVSDREDCHGWRTTMFCRLYDINEKMLEEWALGLSPEFHLNVRWLPGARIAAGEPVFESNVEPHVRGLIDHYRRTWPGLEFINVGRVESSQTRRDRTGEEREVFLVVLGQPDGIENIRLVRMMKWDVMHRIRMGIPYMQAVYETIQYRDYIFDRLNAAGELGIPLLRYTEIRFEVDYPGLGRIPVFFFDRQYVPGIVTDKIPPAYYGKAGFIEDLARLLGVAAAVSLTIGRASPVTHQAYFDDGDEIIQTDEKGRPNRLIIAETTGSFTDWDTPMTAMLPQYISRLSGHLQKAVDLGVKAESISTAIDRFASSLADEIARMQQLLLDSSDRLRSFFMDRSTEPGSIRRRWDGILRRMEETDTEELRRRIVSNPDLLSFQEEP